MPWNFRCVFFIFVSVFVYLLILPVQEVAGWHDFTNADYHCWSRVANKYNHEDHKFEDAKLCKHVHIRWIHKPPKEIKQQVGFNCSIEMFVDDGFWDKAVLDLDSSWDAKQPNVFRKSGNSSIQTGAAAKDWCLNTVCPADSKDANEQNCCIHHVNIHSCPKENEPFCGPWIPPSGKLFTHSPVLVGPYQTGNWSCYVSSLYILGETELIAHIMMADMHIAVYATTMVLPRTVCGDDLCETEEGEECSTCPADCGKCPLEKHEIALIALSAFIVIGILLGIFGYFQWQKRKLLWDESWIYPYDQVKEDTGLRGAFGSMISVNQGSNIDMNQPGSMMSTAAARRQVFATTATVDGRTVAVRKIQKKQFTLTTKIRKEVRAVRQSDHPNLCKFIGGCVEMPNICILMEYCPKGSLNDVLLNEDVPLNWAFRFSFASDISRGMAHLHNNHIMHGRLKSNNCVVDDRWTVKVTDYHLNTYRYVECDPGDEADTERYYTEQRSRVYKAPEVCVAEKSKPTVAEDVYAFSIILVEIATRNDPYGNEDAMYVSDKWKPPVPELGLEQDADNDCPSPEEYKELIVECWNDIPELRPHFDRIKKTLYRMNPNKMSAIDLMMAMMEKYSKHLETVVAERTQDLVAEKQKTDRLLYSMLPRAVAEDLKMGNPINAKKFDVCTIYFSDIVGFTNISGGSTPFEVVALLNKLYVTFDTIIDSFDVYKVETIGDAYMVVSGIPNPTIYHAREVADMSIDIVEACKVFVIPHMPETPLKIRVGLHTGSACAGVVGLKMPRYCLFGDTVNTASRMESNGEAYRIHMSEFTRDALEIVGGYEIECRGAIPVKGKGDMTTYWLNGHTSIGKEDVKQRKISQMSKNSSENNGPPPPSYSSVVDETRELGLTTPESLQTEEPELISNKRSTQEPPQKEEPELIGNKLNRLEPLQVAFTAPVQPTIKRTTMFDLETNDDYLFTPVEFPSIGKMRKISNMSTNSGSNDSGYNEKAEEGYQSGNVHVQEVQVESLVDLGEITDSDAEC